MSKSVYRCCDCCPDDPDFHENGQRDHHDIPCDTCTGPVAALRARAVAAENAVQRVLTVLTTWPLFHSACECGPDHLLRELHRALGDLP